MVDELSWLDNVVRERERGENWRVASIKRVSSSPLFGSWKADIVLSVLGLWKGFDKASFCGKAPALVVPLRCTFSSIFLIPINRDR